MNFLLWAPKRLSIAEWTHCFSFSFRAKRRPCCPSRPDERLSERIEMLAAKSTEGDLTELEREEYVGYVQANKFVAVLRREARKMQAGTV